jgi:Zn-dependent protease with chaperone function
VSLELLTPAFVAAVAGLLTTASHRRLRPPVSARLVVLTMVAVAVAVAPAIVLLALGYIAHLPWFGGALAWCRHGLALHRDVPAWLGLAAVGLLGVGLIRLYRIGRSWRRFRCEHSAGVEIVSSPELFAYTMPGGGGHIVVSSELVARLDRGELAVVVSHERAHARYRHDRFVLVGSIAVAVVPLLMPLQRRLRFALERWADESAVAELDVEPRLVARTLAAVALSGVRVPAGAVGIAGLGVAARVNALLDPPVTVRTRWWATVGTGGVLAVLAAAVVQVHDLLPLLATMCLH